MRDILFKAKIVDDGEWVEGIPFKTHIGMFICFDENPHYCHQYGYMEIDKIIKVDETTICQYTGLTDKAKNKAFENSIIKVISEDEFGVIKYGEYASPFDNSSTKHIGFYVEWQNKTRTNLWGKDLGYWLNDTTIICGNIFDNVELLEASCTNSRTGN